MHISSISQAYLRLKSVTLYPNKSLTILTPYLKHITYLRHNSNIIKVYLRPISDISKVYLKHISDIHKVYFKHISDISQVYLSHITGIRVL